MLHKELPLVGNKVVRAACPQDCPDGCAMLVHVRDSKAVGVEGDPRHPFTKGKLCTKVNDFEKKRTYHSGRVLHPLRLTGPKGSGEFQEISWDEALGEVAERFKAIAEEYGPEALLPIHSLGTIGMLNGMNVGDPFFAKYGASIPEVTFCASASSTAHVTTIGPTAGVDPESLVHSRFILLWSTNTISTNLHLWPYIRQAQQNGAKVVVVDPIRTRTAAAADQHIAVRPGTDGALALAMAHVIVTDNTLMDEEYVANYTTGFDEFRERVLRYTPEWAEQETGVAASTIRTLAQEYAKSQPSVIRIGVAAERQAGGGQLIRTLACLPALVGAWRRPGGGLLQLTLWAYPVNWDAFMRPDMLTPGTRIINQFQLGDALTGKLELDPPVKALFVYNSNPLLVCPDQQRIIKGLERDDLFTVVSEQFLTDTARYADIVFPATTQLEQLDIMWSWGHFYITYNEPAIEPLGEAVPNTELFRRLAARMGYEDAVFQRTDEEMVAESFDWNHSVMNGITLESLKENGWRRLNLPMPDEYAPHAEGNFPTPSGKVELLSSMIEGGGDFILPLFRSGAEWDQPGVSASTDPLPYYIPPRTGSSLEQQKYPLTLLTPKAHAFLNTSFANQERQQRVQKGPFLLINPIDAAARGITDGCEVRVFNDQGEFTVLARIDDAPVAGVVVCPMGAWRKQFPKLATPNTVVDVQFGDLGKAMTFSDMKVNVHPC